MGKSEIESVLMYDEKEENCLYVPSEIFKDFSGIKGGAPDKTFCYSFYYLVMYLYRTVKYGSRYYTLEDLREILGYSRNNQTMDKHIKKRGTLEKMGYLSHTTNYPISWSFDYKEKSISFRYYDDFVNEQDKEEMKHYRENMGLFLDRRNKSIKVPVKGLYRTKESVKNNELDGTFFYISMTTGIPVSAFIRCMSNKNLGTVGFWVYSFIKFKNNYYGKRAWEISRSEMSKEIGIGVVKLGKVLKELESIGMIYNDHKDYVIGVPKEYRSKLKGCSYEALESDHFREKAFSARVRNIISFEKWCKNNGVDYEKYMIENAMNDVDGSFFE